MVGTLLALLVTTVACAAFDEPRSTPTAAPPASTPGPSEKDLAPGWDEPGDGPAPTPAADLTPSQLREMLRLPATGPATATTCTDVDVHVTELDVAMGHRFGTLVVENAGATDCELQGYPGLGARGAWGSTFVLALEQRDPLDPGSSVQPLVPLPPGGRAVANLEWTGALGGAESERAALLVVQLAVGTVPVTVALDPDGVRGDRDVIVDLGTETTVRVGPFAPVG